MKKIVGALKPFILKQDFYVYEDSNKIYAFSTTIDKLSEDILAVAEQYQVNQLDLVGPKQYSKGIGNKIEEAEMAKYNKNILEINYL